MSTRALFAGLLIVVFGLSATEGGAQPTLDGVGNAGTVDKIRNTVARILKKSPAQVDPTRLLVEQGAEELDIMEIVLDVEAEFEVRLPDSAMGSSPGEIGRVLTVERLAQVVSVLPKRK